MKKEREKKGRFPALSFRKEAPTGGKPSRGTFTLTVGRGPPRPPLSLRGGSPLGKRKKKLSLRGKKGKRHPPSFFSGASPRSLERGGLPSALSWPRGKEKRLCVIWPRGGLWAVEGGKKSLADGCCPSKEANPFRKTGKEATV